MTVKDLGDFDFGFSAVSEDELKTIERELGPSGHQLFAEQRHPRQNQVEQAVGFMDGGQFDSFEQVAQRPAFQVVSRKLQDECR